MKKSALNKVEMIYSMIWKILIYSFIPTVFLVLSFTFLIRLEDNEVFRDNNNNWINSSVKNLAGIFQNKIENINSYSNFISNEVIKLDILNTIPNQLHSDDGLDKNEIDDSEESKEDFNSEENTTDESSVQETDEQSDDKANENVIKNTQKTSNLTVKDKEELKEYKVKSNDLKESFENLILFVPYFDDIFLFTTNGTKIVSTSSNDRNYKDLSKIYYENFLNTQKISIIDTNNLRLENRNENEKNVIVPFIFLIKSKNIVKNQGILIFEVNITKLSEKILTSFEFPTRKNSLSPMIINFESQKVLYYNDNNYVMSNDEDLAYLIEDIDEKLSDKDYEIRSKLWEGDKYNFAFRKINDQFSIAFTINTSKISNTVGNFILHMIFAALLIILLMGIFYFILYSFFLKRINIIRSYLNKISAGNLTQKSPYLGEDEVGLLSVLLNKLVLKLSSSWGIVATKSSSLEIAIESLDEQINDSVSSIEEIKKHISLSKDSISQQTEYVTETSAAVEEIDRNLVSLDKLIVNQSKSVTESSSAIEELITNISSITKLTEEASTQVTSLSKMSNEGQVQQNELVGQIRQIALISDHLHEANSLIASMADQTNLLSMNAAIEAAHAGESGRGFAVVAEEIRNLAEQVSEQSESVSQTIYQIQESVEAVVKTSELTSNSFQDIIKQMSKVSQFIANIRQAMQDQNKGTRQIVDSLTGMKEISQSVKSGSKEMGEGNKQILTAITDLQQVNKKVQESSDLIAQKIELIFQDIQKISMLSSENKANIRDLKDAKDIFTMKIEEPQTSIVEIENKND